MNNSIKHVSDIVFTPAVKALQSRMGSRSAYARMENGSGWQSIITKELKFFIEAQVSIFLATANAEGQPYIQHRGGPAGFLRVLDEHTIAFADFAGNRQFISQGNLSENAKAQLFLIDYAQQQRVKIWGEATVIEDDPALLSTLMPADYKARAERVMMLKVTAWDANCHQHIPVRYEAAYVDAEIERRDQRIRQLEKEIRQLQPDQNHI